MLSTRAHITVSELNPIKMMLMSLLQLLLYREFHMSLTRTQLNRSGNGWREIGGTPRKKHDFP